MLHFYQRKTEDNYYVVYPVVETWNGDCYKISIPLHIYRGEKRYISEIRKGNEVTYFTDGINIIGTLFYTELTNQCMLIVSGQGVRHQAITGVRLQDGIMLAPDQHGALVEYACTKIDYKEEIKKSPL